MRRGKEKHIDFKSGDVVNQLTRRRRQAFIFYAPPSVPITYKYQLRDHLHYRSRKRCILKFRPTHKL